VATGIIERKKMSNAYLNQLGRGRTSRATPEYQRVEAAIAKRQLELSELERRFGTPLELPDLEKRAMLGGATKPYAVGYRMFSGDVHAELRSVEDFITNAGGSLQISLTVENELAESTLRAAYVYLVGLMNTCNERLAL